MRESATDKGVGMIRGEREEVEKETLVPGASGTSAVMRYVHVHVFDQD